MVVRLFKSPTGGTRLPCVNLNLEHVNRLETLYPWNFKAKKKAPKTGLKSLVLVPTATGLVMLK